MLLVIDAPADDSLFLPSKLIDYLPLGKPILGLTPLRGASADLIRRLGYPVVAPDDEAAIAAADRGAARSASRQGRLGRVAGTRRGRAQYDIRRTDPRRSRTSCAVRVKPRVLMVTGAYFPETSGGGLQARTVIRALRGEADFSVLTTSADPSLPARSDEDGIPIRRVFVDVQSRSRSSRRPCALAAAFVGLSRAIRHRQPPRLLAKGDSARGVEPAAAEALRADAADRRARRAARGTGAGPAAFWAYRQRRPVSQRQSRACRAPIWPPVFRQPASGRSATRSTPIDFVRRRRGERAALRRELGLPPDLPSSCSSGSSHATNVRSSCTVHGRGPRRERHVGRRSLIGATRSDISGSRHRAAAEIRGRPAAPDCRDRLFFVESTPAIEKYFRAADVYVLPSIREGLPIALIEAMSSGLPCVATRLEGSTDV